MNITQEMYELIGPQGAFPEPCGMKNTKKRMLQKARVEAGKTAEALVHFELVRDGYLMVEKVHPLTTFSKGRMVYRKGKLSGDFRAITDDGFSVLVEVKSRLGSLPYSAFYPHQIEAMNLHDSCGAAVTLVAWVDRAACYLIHWNHLKTLGFGPQCSAKMVAGKLVVLRKGKVCVR
jgi:hypothetical protein